MAKQAVLVKQKIAEAGVANMHSALQHRVKYAREVAWRTANDLEYIDRGGLLFQRLGQALSCFGEFTVFLLLARRERRHLPSGYDRG
jgi:hypothetical protein